MSTPRRRLVWSSWEIRARLILSSWQFWMGVAYFGLVLVVVALYFQNGKILDAARRADRAETIRLATTIATANANYKTCVGSIPELERINGFIRGVQVLHDVLLENAAAAHAVQPPGTPLYRTQEKNITRLRDARVSQVRPFPVPTRRTCLDQKAATVATLATPAK